MASKTRRPENKTRQPASTPRRSITQRIMDWSRTARTGVVMVSVLVFAFALMQVLGELYTRTFLSSLPFSSMTWIVVVACLAVYFVGYVYIIGTPGVKPQASRAQTIFLLVMVVLAAISVVWLIVRTIGAVAE